MSSTRHPVNRGLLALTDQAPPGSSQTNLSLDLRISAWMRRSQFNFEEAQRVMCALRTAILEAAQMDPGSEPVPLTGRSTEADLLSWATYLTGLIDRAARIGRWDAGRVLESTIRHLAA
jgi:hypothetical protein